MRTSRIAVAATLAALAVTLSGCVATGGVQPVRVGELQTIKRGVVVDLKETTLTGKPTGLGGGIGAGAGAVAGSNVGGGIRGMMGGLIVGSLAGAVVGHMVEAKMAEAAGYEIFVKLDAGDEVSVTQAKATMDAIGLKKGDRVRIAMGIRPNVTKE